MDPIEWDHYKNGTYTMKTITLIFTGAMLIATTMITCANQANANETQQQNWQAELAKNLPVLGHRNFIVIADSAYPQQSNPGIKTIYTGQNTYTGTRILKLKKYINTPKFFLTYGDGLSNVNLKKLLNLYI